MATEQPSILQVLGMGQAQSAPPPRTATAAVSGGSAQPSIFDTLGIEPSAKAAPKTPAISMPTRQPKTAQPSEASAPADVPTAANLARKPPMAGVQEVPPIWKTDLATAAKEVTTGASDILGTPGGLEHLGMQLAHTVGVAKGDHTQVFPTPETLNKVFDNAWVDRYAAPGATTAGHVLGVLAAAPKASAMLASRGIEAATSSTKAAAAFKALSPKGLVSRAAPPTTTAEGVSLIKKGTIDAAKTLAEKSAHLNVARKVFSKPEQAMAAQAAIKVQTDAANRLADLENTAKQTVAGFEAKARPLVDKITGQVASRTAKIALPQTASQEALGQNIRQTLETRKAQLEESRATQWNADIAKATQVSSDAEAAGRTLETMPEFKALREHVKSEQKLVSPYLPMHARYQNVRLQLSGRKVPLGEQEQAALDQGLEADIPSRTPATVTDLNNLRAFLANQIKPGAEGYDAEWANRAKNLVGKIDKVLESHNPEGYTAARKNYEMNSRPLDAFKAKAGVAATKTVSPYQEDIHATEAKQLPSKIFSSTETMQHAVDALGHTPEEKAAAKQIVDAWARTHYTEQLSGKSSVQIRDYLTRNRDVMRATGTYQPFSEYADKLQKFENWAKSRDAIAKDLQTKLGSGSPLMTKAAKVHQAGERITGVGTSVTDVKSADDILNKIQSSVESLYTSKILTDAERTAMLKQIETARTSTQYAKDIASLRKWVRAPLAALGGYLVYAYHRTMFNLVSGMTR